MLNTFDITDFGARADGKTDCTAAIQAALDKAGKVRGTVVVPPAEFLCGELKVPAYVTIKGDYAWDWKIGYGGSALKLNNKNAACLLNITGAFGCCISGLSINGADLGKNIHGIYLNWEDRLESRKEFNGAEDTPTVTDCRVSNFSGNAVNYNNVWCCSFRHSMFCFSENGMAINGCDTFIVDCWFSANRKSGMTSKNFMSGTVSDCRFECNHAHGIEMYNAGVMQFVNNYFDANDYCGFYCADEGEDYRGNLVFMGNIFYRDGLISKYNDSLDEFNAHINIAHAVNIIIGSNNFVGGNVGSLMGPKYGIIIKQLKSSVIKDNTMQNSSIADSILDLGGHKEEVIVKDKTGLNSTVPRGKEYWPGFDD